MANQFTVGAGSTNITKPRDANGNIMLDGPNQGMVVGKSSMPYVPAGGDDSALRAAREATRKHDMERAEANRQKQAAEKARLAGLVAKRDANLAKQGNQGFVVGPGNPPANNNDSLLGGADFVIGPTGSGNTSNGGSGASGGGYSQSPSITPPAAPGSTPSSGSVNYGANTGYTAPAQTSVSTYDPATRSVTENELVENRINNMTADDSAYMQRARAAGESVANRRGLLNSSLAGQMSQAAAIDAARPIATEDANAYRTMAADNMNAVNRAGEVNAGQANQIGMHNSQEANSAYKAEQDRLLKREEIAVQDALKRDEMAVQQATERMKQASGQAATYLDSVADIMASDLDEADKQAQVEQFQNQYMDHMNSTMALGDFTVQNGQVTYLQPETVAPDPASETTTDNAPGINYIIPGVTRNTDGKLVDKNGNPSPDGVDGMWSRYEIVNGLWSLKNEY